MAAQLDSMLARLRQFRAGWVSRGWSWDRRLNCVASTFDPAEADQARALILGVLPEEWTSKTLPRAPQLIGEVAQATGGVRSDQLIFATPDARIIAYGLWWPWGGGASNISMRMGLTGAIDNEDMMDLREVFGALDD